MRCTKVGEEMDAGREMGGSLQNWGDCPAGTAICGMNSRFEGDQGAGDDSALNDLKVHCCRICDEDSARFIINGNNNCEACHYSCKTCSGGASNNCLSCFFSESPSSGTCSTLSCII